MDYQKKIEYANRIATELQGLKSSDQIKEELKADGLYDRDITNVFASARKMIGEKYATKINSYLRQGKEILKSDEFASVDQETLKVFIENEANKLGFEERQKITRSVKEGKEGYQILKEVDNRFLSEEQANAILEKMQYVKEQNSGSGRIINIGGGIALFVLTAILLFTTDRLFYFLPIIGLGLIAKGIMTKKMDYDD